MRNLKEVINEGFNESLNEAKTVEGDKSISNDELQNNFKILDPIAGPITSRGRDKFYLKSLEADDDGKILVSRTKSKKGDNIKFYLKDLMTIKESLNEAKEKSIDKLEKSLEKALKGSKDRDYDFAVWLDSNWEDVTGWDEDDKFEEQDWHENVHTLIDKFSLDIDALEQGNWESVTS